MPLRARTPDEHTSHWSATHTSERRPGELFWIAYTKMIAATSSLTGPAHCFLLARSSAASPDGEIEVEVELLELTKRQRGLVGGGCEVLGHKIKPLTPDGKPDPGAKSWSVACALTLTATPTLALAPIPFLTSPLTFARCIAWSEEEAAAAYADLTEAEPCVYLAPDGVYVATRMKRALCKGLSAPMKSVKEVEALVASLAPEKPLKSLVCHTEGPNPGLAGPRQVCYSHVWASPWTVLLRRRPDLL